MRYSIIGATVEQVKSAGGANIKESLTTGIIFATLTEEQAARLTSLGFTVSKVGEVKTQVMPPTPVAAVPTYTPEELIYAAGFEQLRNLTTPPLYGEGINVAVIGSGIRETHELIQGRVVYRKNLTSAPMRDDFDHDTGVASIILSGAPKCSILNMKVLDEKGNGTEEEVVMALDDLLTLCDENSEYAPDVINLSLGEADDGNPNNPIRIACRAAIQRGVWVTAAAGNMGPASGTIMCPACERYVCAMGCCKLEPFTISEFSSRGPTKEGLAKPDAVFIGENIEMASSASDTATIGKSGTSFSTPFCSAAWVLYFEGMRRQVSWQLSQYPELAGPIQEAFKSSVSPERGIDYFLPLVTIKPQGVPKGKDDAYGNGLPFGPLVAQAFGVTFGAPAAVDLSSLVGALTSVVSTFFVVGFVGMIGARMFRGGGS